MTSNDNLFSCSTSACNCSYSSNGLYGNHTGDGVAFYLLNSVPSGNHSVEFEIANLGYGHGNYCNCIIFDGIYLLQNSSNGYQIRSLGESAQSWNTPKLAVGDKVRADMEDGTVKIYVNDVLKGTKTAYNTQTGLYFTESSRSITVKNLKIKPL